MTTLNTEIHELRERAISALARTKEKISRCPDKMVSVRMDPRTIVVARPDHIGDIVKRINENYV